MIGVMRRYRRLLQIGLLLVIAAFVLTSVVVGTMNGGSDRADAVASVNGELIPLERYQRRYQAYLDAYSRVYRDRFSPELAEQLGLPQQAVNDLVQEALVVQRARAEGLEVTDEELNAQIQAVPAFQDSGRFSLRLYQEFLKRRGISAGTFEADVRRELTRLKVETTVKSGMKVSDAELEQAFVTRREEVRAAWALIDTGALTAAATASDDEVEAYLKGHADEFRQPERRRVQYATLAPKDFRPRIADEEVQKYYTEHTKEFETPRQVRGSHVLVPVPQTGGSEAEDKARARAAEVIRRATASTLAKADELGAGSLALVAFGTGVGGFPLEEAARIEVEEVRRHLDAGSALELIVFAVRGDAARAAFEQAVDSGDRRQAGSDD